MGELLFVCGISSELFNTFRLWLSRLKGGLGVATVGASALFAAASGSSLANTATMGIMASKEMLKAGYNKSLIGGSIVAGGTLGPLIPPSTLFIIYGMMTEQSIGQLLIAGLIPGMILMALYMLTIFLTVSLKPDLAPAVHEKPTWKDRLVSLKSTIWIIILFVVVIGGMYFGIFNPTEAAGIGACATFFIAIIRKKLTVKNFIADVQHAKNDGFYSQSSYVVYLNYFLTITSLCCWLIF